MGFFSESEVGALRIRRMILHVVSDREKFRAQQELATVQQEGFFLQRIREVNASGLFTFTPTSQTRSTIEHMATGVETFQAGGQELARGFANQHVAASKDGAFFVFEMDAGDPATKLYALLKYDYRAALERTNRSGKTILRRIIDAFIEDRRALQKSCLIRVVNGRVLDEVSAKDRMGKQPNLTDFFTKFLDVQRDRSDEELNRSLIEAVRSTLVAVKDLLPGGDVARAFAQTKDTLRNRTEIDDDAVAEAIYAAAGSPQIADDEDFLKKATELHLRRQKLTGIAFKPDPHVLRRASRRQVRTVEGILIEYPENLENASVRRQSRPGGGTIFTIETARVEGDTILRDRARD